MPGVISRARLMHLGIAAVVAMFPSPSVSMAAFLLLLQDLEAAQTDSKAGKGLAPLRNTKLDLLWTAMESLRVYVQGLCDGVSVEAAINLINTAGLVLAKNGVRVKPILQAKLVETTGLVQLIANATALVGKTSKKVTFAWQWSPDGGTKVWNNLPSTPHAVTTIANLGPGTYSFRVSVTVGKIVGPWSQNVSLTIH